MGVEEWFPQCPHFLLLPQILLLLGHLDPHGLIAFSSNHTLRSVGRTLTTLRAHHIRIVGVVGSNPIRSTRKSRKILKFHGFFVTFLQKYWAHSSTVSLPFRKNATEQFACPLYIPFSHFTDGLFSHYRKPKNKRSSQKRLIPIQAECTRGFASLL